MDKAHNDCYGYGGSDVAPPGMRQNRRGSITKYSAQLQPSKRVQPDFEDATESTFQESFSSLQDDEASSKANTAVTLAKTTARVPLGLQKVFLHAANGEVPETPPKNQGDKIFNFKWWQGDRKPVSFNPLAMMKNSPSNVNRKKDKKDRTTQEKFDKKLKKRGYSTKKYSTMAGGYYGHASSYQNASYGTKINEVVSTSNVDMLDDMLKVGLSPNPCCHDTGESLVHTVCAKGDTELLRVLLRHGSSVQVSDNYGRTPLHEACLNASYPNFKIVLMLLEEDKNLFKLRDFYGKTPLSYIHESHHKLWNEFLKANMNLFWPTRDPSSEGQELPPSLTTQDPFSQPIPDPENALPPKVAFMVANGHLSPQEALVLTRDLFDSDEESENDDDDDNTVCSEVSEDLDFIEDMRFFVSSVRRIHPFHTELQE